MSLKFVQMVLPPSFNLQVCEVPVCEDMSGISVKVEVAVNDTEVEKEERRIQAGSYIHSFLNKLRLVLKWYS